jgi:hypothetical protein
MPMNSDTQKATHIRSRVRDYVLYVAISIALVVAGITISHTSINRDALNRWGGLVVYTAILFGYFIDDSRQFIRKWPFWKMIAILLSVHLAAFGYILTHADVWKFIWFTVMMLEFPVLVFFRNRLRSYS